MVEKTYDTVMEALSHPANAADAPTEMKIAGTVYEIHTHWNPEGRQTMLEQLMKLILSADLKESTAV